MNNIHFDLKDLRWAICFAGAAISSKNKIFRDINPSVNFSFSDNGPGFEFLVQDTNFSRMATTNAIKVGEPPEGILGKIDEFHAIRHAGLMQAQHGIKADPKVRPLGLQQLAATALTLQFKLATNEELYFPKLNQYQLKNAKKYDLILEDNKYQSQAKKFLEIQGIKDPEILVLDESNLSEAIKAINLGVSLVLVNPRHPLSYVLRAYYTDFDCLPEVAPIMAPTEALTDPMDRYILTWMQQIPFRRDDQESEIIKKAEEFKMFKAAGFDHRKLFANMTS